MKLYLYMACLIGLIAMGPREADSCVQITSDIPVRKAVWSPDGGTIAFHRLGGGIYTVPADGGQPVLVVQDAGWPAWSPDGARLAYTLSGDIWVRDVGGGVPEQITSWPGLETQPDWSPDGDKIVYSRWEDASLYVYSFSGGSHIPLTVGTAWPHSDGYAVWNPNGDQILFEQNVFLEGPDVFVVEYPSGLQAQLFDHSEGYREARWHPSGASLIILHGEASPEVPDTDCVVSYPMPLGPPCELECRQPSLRFPCWAPDGQRFSFVEDDDLFVCDAPIPVEATSWGRLKSRFSQD